MFCHCALNYFPALAPWPKGCLLVLCQILAFSAGDIRVWSTDSSCVTACVKNEDLPVK